MTLWPFQPEMSNDVFDDDIDGQDGGQGLTGQVSHWPSLTSDRRDYMSLAAVPRVSRPSTEQQVPTAPTTAPHRGVLGLTGGGVSALRV